MLRRARQGLTLLRRLAKAEILTLVATAGRRGDRSRAAERALAASDRLAHASAASAWPLAASRLHSQRARLAEVSVRMRVRRALEILAGDGHDAAIAYLRAAPKGIGNHADIGQCLVDILIAKGDFEAAWAGLPEAGGRGRDAGWALREAALRALSATAGGKIRKDCHARADALARQALKGLPHGADHLAGWGGPLPEAGLLSESDETRPLRGRCAQLLFDIGRMARSEGARPLAETCFEAAHALRPSAATRQFTHLRARRDPERAAALAGPTERVLQAAERLETFQGGALSYKVATPFAVGNSVSAEAVLRHELRAGRRRLSVIEKIMRPGRPADAERNLLKSGLLQGPGWRAPTLLDAFSDTDGMIHLLMDDMGNERIDTADSTEMAAATAAVATFNARFCASIDEMHMAAPQIRRFGLSGPLPNPGWEKDLARVPLLATQERRIGRLLESCRSARDLLTESGRDLPETLCHADLSHSNILRCPAGFAMIDWADAGIGPVGTDLARLLSISRLSEAGNEELVRVYTDILNGRGMSRALDISVNASIVLVVVRRLAKGIVGLQDRMSTSDAGPFWLTRLATAERAMERLSSDGAGFTAPAAVARR